MKMRNRSTWGGAIEIKAFCNMYNKHVNVHDVRTSKRSIINFIDDNYTYKLYPSKVT